MLQKHFVDLLDRLVPEEGVIPNIIDKVDLFRISDAAPREPKKYEPSIIILAQGKKRIFVGEDVYEYDPLHYLALTVPLPIECETTASVDKPMLGIRIQVDAAAIGEILLAMDDAQQAPKQMPKCIYSAPIDSKLMDTCIRLLDALSSPEDRKFLGPMVVREILYRILQGEKGDALRALAFRNQRFFQIARTLDRIHESYEGKLTCSPLPRKLE